ncbi:G2/M phase-specific E3 ubiquitin-protein ligase [Holothuria leucospilota]|uniref:HECT-type E3 ubiquitin transferase n=1 Tax=Holothuria leucospilota TaxID=206669 RepID=A0A9Q1BQ16_HOLLE|nr:G2/M phase-specific E3 ubiquitin-protein ligase [Holothuria leucospilota]
MQEKLRVFQSLQEDQKIDLVVRRKRVLKSAADAINNQLGFSFYGVPVITFSGEDAVDLGGPKREFFTMATQQLPQLGVFEGKQNRMYFSHEIALLEKGLYRLAGQIIAWSILHGGPGFPALHPFLYSMMCGSNNTDTLCISDITDPDVLDYLQKIENCSSDEQLTETVDLVGDWAANNGCTGIYGMKMNNKDEIVKTLCKQHIYYRCKSEIDDFQQGLNSIGDFWNMVKEDSAPFKCLLVQSDNELTFPEMKKLFHMRWSENSALVDKEEDTVYSWEQFIRKSSNGECSQVIKLDDGTTETAKIALHHILRFCTGADAIPPLGFDKQVDIHFFSVTPGVKPLPTASTCGLELHLPRGMDEADEFTKMMIEAIVCSPGYGKT